jgi:two-component system cell cycle response regulator
MNILHVEKSSLVSKVMKRIITESGNSVFNTADSKEAFNILDNEEIAFIIIGLDGDDSEGAHFLRKLHEDDCRGLPVLVLTEDDDLKIDDRLFNLGVVDLINKKYISDDNFKRYFDIFLREDRLLKQLRDLKIAVLDDNQQCLSNVKALLDFNRIKKVDYFTEPEELLAGKDSYDFYILDLVMPRVSGEKVIKNIRERNKDSMIIVVTSSGNEKLLNTIIVSGADDFISKPFTANTFMSRMKANARHYSRFKSIQQSN